MRERVPIPCLGHLVGGRLFALWLTKGSRAVNSEVVLAALALLRSKGSRLALTAASLTLLAMMVSLGAGSPGELDAGFDGDGKLTTGIGSSHDYGQGVAVQPDGKIVAVGAGWGGSNFDFALVRYNPDGSLDTTLNSTGIVTTAVSSSYDHAYAVAIQRDDKIVVAGEGDFDFALVRYNPDGSLDSALNHTGIVTTPIGSADHGRAIAIQGDGKIVVAGWSAIGIHEHFALVRYNPDGSLDTSLNSTGIVTTAIGGNHDYGYAVAVQPDGKIVLAGHSQIGSDNSDVALVRYHSDGSLDSTLNGTGIVTTTVGRNYDTGYAVAIQPDGKIVVAGSAVGGYNLDFALVRYNPDGSLDTSLNSTGIVTTPIGSSHDYGYAATLQCDNKIVVAGESDNGSDDDFALVRYNPDGSLDAGFSSDGKVTTDIGSDHDNGRAVAIQRDGKIVVAGSSRNGGTLDFAVVRYIGDPPLGISKAVTPETKASYHGTVTYTVVLSNSAGTDAVGTLLTDTLPSQVDFARWVERPARAGVADDQITWSGTVMSTEAVTFTFVATHTGGYGDVVTNTVEYAYLNCRGARDIAFSVEPTLVYLPVLLRYVR